MKSKRFFWLTLALLMALLLLPPAPARAEDTYRLIVRASPEEAGTVSGGGNYAPAEIVAIDATAYEGWVFDHWEWKGSDISVDHKYDYLTSVVLGSGYTGGTITAVFKKVYPLDVKVSPAGAGTVTGGGNYAPKEKVTLTATANQGWVFDHWECGSDDVVLTSEAGNSVTAELYAGFTGATVTAVFVNYPLTVKVSPAGVGTVTGGGNYVPDDIVTLTATANQGWVFDHWECDSGDVYLPPKGNPVTAELLSGFTGATVTAVFKGIPCAVTVEADPAEGGSVTGAGSYTPGDKVTLTATANEGYKFDGWQVVTGGVTVADDGTFTMPAEAVEVKARFRQLGKCELEVVVANGTGTGSGAYYEGQRVPIVATPSEGWVFSQWTCSYDAVIIEDVNAASTYFTYTGTNVGTKITLTAAMEEAPYFAVTVTADPAEGGSVTGGGDYQAGKTVTLTATPNEGWKFKAWSSADVTVAENGTFEMPAKAVAVKATFELIPYYDVTVTCDPAEGGSVTGGGDYAPGKKVTLTVTPATGYRFKAWSSADVTVAEDGTFEMPAKDVAVTAAFELIPYPVTVTCDPAEGGSVSGAGTYAPGETVTLIATANDGWKFKAWQVTQGNLTVGEDGTFVMPAKDVAVTAKFVATYTLSGKAPRKADAAWADLPRKVGERERVSLQLHFPSASYEAGYRLNAITLTDDAGNVSRFTKDAAGRTLREEAPLPGSDGVSSYTLSFDMPASNLVAAAEFVRMTVRWYDGDGSVLDEKYYYMGEPEPTTYLQATKPADDEYYYTFDRWDDGAVEGDLKYYRPIFHQYPFYTIVEGADSTYRLQSGKLLTIVVKRSAKDDTIVEDLTNVLLDKTFLEEGKDYVAKQGTLILNIKPAAMNKLSVGKHIVTISFVDGEVKAKVRVKEAYDDYTGTGDNSHMFLWLALAAMGTMGLVGLRVLRKRQWE